MKERAAVSHLIERGTELGMLSSVVEAADAGRGGVAVIGGPAGIGKTSLVDAAAQLAAERDLGVLRARGMELETDYGYGVSSGRWRPCREAKAWPAPLDLQPRPWLAT